MRLGDGKRVRCRQQAEQASPSVRAAPTGIYGQEGSILRFLLVQSIALARLVGGVASLMAHVYPFTAPGSRTDALPIADGLAGQRESAIRIVEPSSRRECACLSR